MAEGPVPLESPDSCLGEIPESPTSDLEGTFNAAASHLQTLASNLDSGQLLGFYGLYKQATCGSCDIPKPSWYQTQARHKWEAWKSLGDMSQEVAMASYIRAVGKLDPTWEMSARSGSVSGAWVAVSSLPNTDTELKDKDKTLFDWVKDENHSKVHETLIRKTTDVHLLDENRMTPLHWAADRGFISIMENLVEAGADFNAQDIDGQTPLHYAASCGHEAALKYLLSLGAKVLEDNDGLTPKDIADEALVAMF